MTLPDAGVRLVVAGVPQPKGSTRAFVVNGRAVVTSDNRNLKDWQAAIAWEARAAWAALDDPRPIAKGVPVAIEATFHVRRPKRHYRASGALRPDAPTWCTTRPDVDKFERAVLDALTAIAYVDDQQVVALRSTKPYGDDFLGLIVVVRTLDDQGVRTP